MPSRSCARRTPRRRRPTRSPRRSSPRRWTTDPDAEVSVFLALTSATRGPEGFSGVTASRADLLTAELAVADARELRHRRDVASVELGQPLTTPAPAVVDGEPRSALRGAAAVRHGRPARLRPRRADRADRRRRLRLRPPRLPRRRRPHALRAHLGPGRRRRGRARRSAGRRRSTTAPSCARRTSIARSPPPPNRASRPPSSSRQSQMEEGSHGTHVASIAAGNHGVSREAWIAGVLISIPDSDQERRRSFYDSTRLAHAVDYLLAVADELGAETGSPVPVSINVSLGTNGARARRLAPRSAAGSTAALTRPGRSVCVASGNAGQERGELDGDIGWVMGRVHSSGRVARARAGRSTSSGTWSAMASPTCPRTSWRSGTARRTASRCRSSRRACPGRTRSSPASTSRTASCPI